MVTLMNKPDLPKYTIKHVVIKQKKDPGKTKSEYFQILKPDETAVNDLQFDEEGHAREHLDRLIAMGYCR